MTIVYYTVVVLLIYEVHVIYGIDQTKFHKSDKNQVYYIENKYTHDWYQALTACARMNMTLLSLEGKDKTDEVNRLVMQIFGKNVVLWIGGYAVGPLRQYTWISTGEPFTYTFWSSRNPDFYNQEEFCAYIGQDAEMRWNDQKCTNPYGYICEYQPKDECNCNQKYANMTFNFYNQH